MKTLLKITLLAMLCSCSTYNIIIVSDKEFMDEVKSDYNVLFMNNMIDKINSMQAQPTYKSCPLMQDLIPGWPADKFKPEY